MRVLFSSTVGAGHLQPLLPYARELVARGHEVAVAAPVGLSEALRGAGLPHFVFDRPDEDLLQPIERASLETSRARKLPPSFLYLALRNAEKKRTMVPRFWNSALNLEDGERRSRLAR